MLPSVRRVAVSEAVFASCVALVLLAEFVPLLGWFFNPHSTLGGIGLLVLLLVVICVLLVLLVSLPVAVQSLVKSPSQRTISKVVVVTSGCLLAAGILIWLAGPFRL
jgi:hypothetical protein